MQPQRFEQAMRGELADMTKGVLSAQMSQGFPNAEVFLVELLAGEFDGDAFLAGDSAFLQENPILALYRSEKGRADKAVGRASLGFRPQRKLNALRRLALADGFFQSLKATRERLFSLDRHARPLPLTSGTKHKPRRLKKLHVYMNTHIGVTL